MNKVTEFLDGVIKASLAELDADPIPIHTFAFYHDHEFAAVSVCADTKESSLAVVQQSNQWSMAYFAQHVQAGEPSCLCAFGSERTTPDRGWVSLLASLRRDVLYP